jgi:anti-anti-sigma factor
MFPFEKQGAVGVVHPKGPLEASHCDELKRIVMQGLGAGRPMLVVDFHDVPLVDSVGLETLVELRDSLELKGGAVKFAAINPLCADILRVTGVGHKFEQHALVRSAVGSFAE